MAPVTPKHRRSRAAAAGLACAITALLTACGSGGGDEPAASATRSFALSATAVQAVAGGQPFYQYTPPGFSAAVLADDVDVLTVFLEHYGVPWDEFAASNQPPDTHPWTVAMRSFAAGARATGKPLAVQLVLSRQRLAARARAQGTALLIDDDWQAPCFDFATHPDAARYRLAYARYATWIATLFEPRDLVSGVEISSARTGCASDTAWQALVGVANDAFDAVKAVRPSTRVYPSFILADLYGGAIGGFDANLVAQLSSLKRDRLGLSAYPQGMRNAAGGRVTPSELPTDFFSRLRDRNPSEAPVVITETGWNSDDLTVRGSSGCSTLLSASADTAAAYLDVVLARAATQRIELVTWWSARDLLPQAVMTGCAPKADPPAFSACLGDAWCIATNIFRASTPTDPAVGETLFKAFATMGLRRYDGAPKSALVSRWEAARAQPLAVSP
jgi:hypothetical protein